MITDQDLKNFQSSENQNLSNLEELIKKNIQTSEEILHIAKKIKRYMFMENVWSWIKVIIIVGPLIAGVVLLKGMMPMLQKVYNQYQEILNIGGQANQLNSMPISADELLKVGESLKSGGIK
jgi:hypothetical protein